MNYRIIKLKPPSGSQTTFYSIIKHNDTRSVFEKFIAAYQEDYEEELKDIMKRLQIMGSDIGAREQYFKKWEGGPGDLVCALYDTPAQKLRLYCIRFGSTAVILGGGGPKPKAIRTWQDDKTLDEEARRMISVSQDIYNRIKNDELKWSQDGKTLLGNLNFINDDD